ncbi:MAG: hypothetical protein LBB67_01465 [Oscillospiraceae bacterium]|jgi:stage IV sporulation protein FB|nr:hypothetical protein [Oscillospiraceae bacterium]
MLLKKEGAVIEMSITFAAFVVLCFCADSVRRISLGLFFAAIHECGHLAAMRIFGAKPNKITLSAAGVRLCRPPSLRLSYRQEIIIALAGPAASACLGGLFALPLLVGASKNAIWLWLIENGFWINSGFAVFNMLPVEELDGGRTLYFLLCRVGKESTANMVTFAVSLVILFFFAAATALQWMQARFPIGMTIATLYVALCIGRH